MLEIVANNPLYVSEYTKDLFPNGIITADFGTVKDGYAFIEDPVHLQQMSVDILYIFKWNRHYPSNARLAINMAYYTKIAEEEFVGSSHEKITLEVYKNNK